MRFDRRSRAEPRRWTGGRTPKRTTFFCAYPGLFPQNFVETQRIKSPTCRDLVRMRWITGLNLRTPFCLDGNGEWTDRIQHPPHLEHQTISPHRPILVRKHPLLMRDSHSTGETTPSHRGLTHRVHELSHLNLCVSWSPPDKLRGHTHMLYSIEDYLHPLTGKIFGLSLFGTAAMHVWGS